MTLILTSTVGPGLIQVSDRLLTTLDGREFEKEANKTLILVAPKGVAVVSFWGLAHIKRRLSDIRMAEILTGEIEGFQGQIPMQGPCFNNRHRSIDDMIFAIRAGLSCHFRDSLAARMHEFGLSVCGWRIRSRVWEPFVMEFKKEKRKVELKLQETMPRRWWYSTGCISAVPEGNVSKTQLERINQMHSRKYNSLEEYFSACRNCYVDIIRETARSTGVVGVDGMCICVYPPKNEGALITVELMYLEKRFVMAPIKETVPATMTPWVITQRNFFGPSIITGGEQNIVVGGITVRLIVPENDKGVWMIGGQPYNPNI